ncbi:hypothetical protein N657DRAFT_670998 [Parathielavia appendiculata]|uniref:C2H2-type domain-containing protein n=1 Tax=Parathielavia appendiculata TaxID=2587402 RepID=A0AAN6Z4R6_9PEZI|nr:hypothetical protein N657DRAFT_670998 [Parathielavia appendiculata]
MAAQNNRNICRYDLCMASFTSNEELVNHIALSHAGDDLACRDCGLKCISKATLARHRGTHGEGERHACFIEGCNEEFPRRDSLGNHLLSKHEDYLKEAVSLYETYCHMLNIQVSATTITDNGGGNSQNNGW